MADPATPNYGLVLPTVGMDRDAWGGLTNANWQKVDTELKRVDDLSASGGPRLDALIAAIGNLLEPPGSLKAWAASTPPAGWFVCDGGQVSRTAYADLFAAIGTTWGAGNGTTTFNLPDFRDCVVAHRGGTLWFTGRFGELTHTLSVAEMPLHRHDATAIPNGNHAHGYLRTDAPVGGSIAAGGNREVTQAAATTDAAGDHGHAIAMADTGGGVAHNNIQPTVAALWCIKAVKFTV